MGFRDKAQRLERSIRDAGISLHGLALLDTTTTPPLVRVDYNGATASQQTTAQGLVDTFDWGDAAQVTWENTQTRVKAKQFYDNTVTHSEQAKLLRALVAVLLDEINILRTHAAIGLPARTMAQAKTSIQNKIDAGTVD